MMKLRLMFGLLLAAAGADAAVKLEVIGRYDNKAAVTGGMEIATFDPGSKRAYCVDGTAKLYVLNLANPALPVAAGPAIDLSSYGGGANSVSAKNGILAVAMQAADPQANGSLVLFNASNGNFIAQYPAGAMPDMVTFSPNGQLVISANEGEPHTSYTNDPEGSITIVDISAGAASGTATNAGFASFNGQLATLRSQGVRIYGPNATVAKDLEPEYVAVAPDGTKAWVTLQENNALAVVDLVTKKVTSIVPLGYKNHALPGNEFDPSDRDGAIKIGSWPVMGMYQPDAIAPFMVGSNVFLVTANEGDARDYAGFAEEVRGSSMNLNLNVFPNSATLKLSNTLGRLNFTSASGDVDTNGTFDVLYAYGARSFSIWNANGAQVFDSGSELERITAQRVPTLFNSDGNSAANFDTRSDNKGPEPEGVAVGVIGGRTYAFLCLERVNGVMTYDVSNPAAPKFSDYARPSSDNAPEGLFFIPASESPNGEPLVVVSHEVSGTLVIFAVRGNTTTGVDLVNPGNDDFAFYRGASGAWFAKDSASATSIVNWGWSGVLPCPADFDGDGLDDHTVFDRSTGLWYIRNSAGGASIRQWGAIGDLPVPADFDGDRIADLAVYSPTMGQWFIRRSTDGSLQFHILGGPGHAPVLGDWNGDGRTDAGAYNGTTGNWRLLDSATGNLIGSPINWGWNAAVPYPADYDGDGVTDLAVFWQGGARWYIREADGGTRTLVWGNTRSAPVPGDYDNDGKADFAVYTHSTLRWNVLEADGGTQTINTWGLSDSYPVNRQYILNVITLPGRLRR